MKKKIYLNSMIVRILSVVSVGIFAAILLISMIVINISKQVFIETYGKSQEQVLSRIQEELNGFHEDLVKIIEGMNSSLYLKLHLEGHMEHDPNLSFQTTYRAKRDIRKVIPPNMDNFSVLIISTQMRSYINKEEKITKPIQEIMEMDFAKDALNNPDKIQYVFQKNGYTSSTRNEPVLIAIKALKLLGTQQPYAVAFFIIKEAEITKFYEYFTSDNTECYIVNQSGTIISSSNKEKLGIDMELQDSPMKTILQKNLPYYQSTIYGVIDNQKALDNQYKIPLLWLICAGIIAGSVLVIFIVVRQTTKPLSELVKKMSNARMTKFDEHIVPTGSKEVRELSTTYNAMLDDLNRYIDELMTIQRQKRKAEITALQMQINPHYIYNTLASIKWLIFQGNTKKSTQTIDAFISLLRNTISNTDEYITVEKDIENLKNYVLINNTRYGDRVRVEYFIAFGCNEYKIPKMILQPFVENAFFHAFPNEQKGTIEIFVRALDGKLQIQIEDDGVGMTSERLMKLTEKNRKVEHFGGIGINNVDDRLQLIYGQEYGIQIQSEENNGTTVTIFLPKRQ
ncbi:MAG: sensor histidine kinase [Clostridiales bacterium]|nr:sensor histidine kinase [Clostridiales bacterium]